MNYVVIGSMFVREYWKNERRIYSIIWWPTPGRQSNVYSSQNKWKYENENIFIGLRGGGGAVPAV